MTKFKAECSGSKVYFATSGSAVTTLDLETRAYRASTLQDIYDFSRLSDKFDNRFIRCS